MNGLIISAILERKKHRILTKKIDKKTNSVEKTKNGADLGSTITNRTDRTHIGLTSYLFLVQYTHKYIIKYIIYCFYYLKYKLVILLHYYWLEKRVYLKIDDNVHSL